MENQESNNNENKVVNDAETDIHNNTVNDSSVESFDKQSDPAEETREFTAVTEDKTAVTEISEATREFSAVTEKAADDSEKQTKKKKKKSKNGPVRIVILVVCVAVFAFSGYKIISEIIDGVNTQKMSEDLWDSVRGDDVGPEDNHDDINVPPAPIDPNVSGSGSSDKGGNKTETVENNTETKPEANSGDITDPESDSNTDPETQNNTDPETQNNTDPVEGNQPADPSDNNVDPTEEQNPENDSYNDRTYEEELQEQNQISEEEDTQYYVSRPSRDKETYEPGIVIRPEDIKMSSVSYLRASNLKNLLKVNEDTVGWIYIPGSKEETKGMPIDTAIVQTTDNDFYLDHTFDKVENINGWVYADYRCNTYSITSNYNTVIYGHARSYKMFGGLKDLNEAVEWYSNGYNHFIKINTFYDETVWQIFSWYETDIYFDYIKTDFADSNDFIRFAYEVQSKNQMEGVFESFDFTENDRILTLSTCKGFDRAVRIAVHAKLVKRNPLN